MLNKGVIVMAGRPPKPASEKKIREAVYFDPHLLEWLRDLAEREKVTVSVVVNRLVEKAKEARA
jgi:histone deacetylase complex regulatory component SIN3